jgi:hypothetical protein
MVSKQALSKAIQKINPFVFIHLLKEFHTYFYTQESLVKKHKGYIILAEDGSSIEIPYSQKNLDYYQFIRSNSVKDAFDVKKIFTKCSGLYDVLNGFFLTFSIGKAYTSDIPLAYLNIYRSLDNIKGHQSIYLADRYYGSAEIISLLERKGSKYCIRAKSNFYKEQIAQVEKDGIIELKLTTAWLKRFKLPDVKEYAQKNTTIRIRVVKDTHTYKNAKGKACVEDRVYLTNLPTEEFSREDIVELYTMRWTIETNYRYLKTYLELERVNTTHRTSIESKIYAKILFMNMVGIIKAELDALLCTKITIHHKDGFKVKVEPICAHLYDSDILLSMLEGNQRKIEREIKDIVEVAKKNIVPIRKDRHYKRYGRFLKSPQRYKYRIDGRSHPRVRSYGGGLITIKP